MDQNLLWAIVLLLLGLSCVVLEMFIPSAGMLGLLATFFIIAAIVLAFLSGPLTGAGMVLAVTILVPCLLGLAVKYWPQTPMGKAIMLKRPDADEVLPQTEAYRGRQQLVGQNGIAQSNMLPSGVVVINGKTYDAISNGMPIEAGATIRVIGIDTQRLVVRADTTPAQAKTTTSSSQTEVEDPFA
jgi:membrane-bound ClpP family serine protease